MQAVNQLQRVSTCRVTGGRETTSSSIDARSIIDILTVFCNVRDMTTLGISSGTGERVASSVKTLD